MNLSNMRVTEAISTVEKFLPEKCPTGVACDCTIVYSGLKTVGILSSEQLYFS
jgi:hypothetical protein